MNKGKHGHGGEHGHHGHNTVIILGDDMANTLAADPANLDARYKIAGFAGDDLGR
jgi:hypothetical protein